MAEGLDFGGRTPQAPCTALLGICSWEDYDFVRQKLQLEHNALVRSLNVFNNAVGDGKASWKNAVADAAYAVYEESRALSDKYPTSAIAWALQGSIVTMSAGAVGTMIEMAIRDHAAAADVDALLEGAGVAVPQKPIPPPPTQTMGDEYLNFTKAVAKGSAILIAVGLIGVLAYRWATAGASRGG